MKPIVVALISFIATIAYGGESEITHLEGELEKVFPGAITIETTVKASTYLFCPDETCIEVKEKNNNNLKEFSLIYLYYFGDYYELENWRHVDGIKSDIHSIANEVGLSACYKHEDALKECLKNKLKQKNMKVYNLRYDEGVKSRYRVW